MIFGCPGYVESDISKAIEMAYGGNRGIRKHSKKTGFSLIELVVVVGIIAMLLMIVIPSLYKAQGRVQTVTCQSNIKQWGIYLVIYANDNNGFLPAGSRDWVTVLQPYSTDSSSHVTTRSDTLTTADGRNSITCCPQATQPSEGSEGQPFVSYILQSEYTSEQMAVGSYGINGWICNAPPSETEIFGVSTRNNWRRFDVGETTSKIPLVLDSMWMRAFPDNTNLPPEKNGDFDGCDPTGGGKRQMRHFCINRHEGGTNGSFMDLSVRKIGLKELWKLKWHRGSDLNVPESEWPEWMQVLPDYN